MRINGVTLQAGDTLHVQGTITLRSNAESPDHWEWKALDASVHRADGAVCPVVKGRDPDDPTKWWRIGLDDTTLPCPPQTTPRPPESVHAPRPWLG